MTEPVTDRRIKIASNFIENAVEAAFACRLANLPFFVACALLEMESDGKNVYGHDKGGALSGYPFRVDRSNYRVFEWLVSNGMPSNGVGPCQITYVPYFGIMRARNLAPWLPQDNMRFGFELLAGNYARTKSWEKAGAQYNGGPRPNLNALKYGGRFAGQGGKVAQWKKRLEIP